MNATRLARRDIRIWFPWLMLGVGFLAAFLPATVSAAEKSGKFVDLVYADAAGQHRYALFVPAGYTPEKKWPVILFLHGAGERGVDGQKPLAVGLGPYVRQQARSFPALVVFPQCEDLTGRILSGWGADSPDGRRAIEILNAVEKNYSVDPGHRILTGWSMGGYGVWSLAAAMPGYWSSIVAIAGGGDVSSAEKLKGVPIWAIHGTDDTVVRPEESRQMVEAANAAGGNARYSEVSGVGHDVWKYAYANEALYRWMLDPAGASAARAEFRAKPGERPPLQASQNEPFVPAVEIQNALFIRMGNDMLKTLADSVPKIIPKDVLTGGIRDIYDSTVAQGYFFNVHFSQISYSGTVERAVVRAYRKDRLNVQLGLRNVNLRIGQTYVTGESHSAVAGPMNIVLAHRRPIWLNLALEPYVKDRMLRVRLVGTWFTIPSDNWYVTAPAGVSTQGFGMTRDDVSGGLVNGIYGKKNRIEKEISAVVPKLLAQIESSLNRPQMGDVMNAFWPLPVYHPRLRVWPQEVSTDEKGISLMMGVTAAAVDPKRAPAVPRSVEASSVSLADRPTGTGLSVDLAPNILQPLTQLLIDADMARIHLSDIPEKRFGLLGDRSALANAIPELSRLAPSAELWGELILTSPISILDGPQDGTLPSEGTDAPAVASEPVAATNSATVASESLPGSATSEGKTAAANEVPTATPETRAKQHALRISAPRVLIALAYRPVAGQGDWIPLVDFEFSVGQEATAAVDRPSFEQRVLRLGWSGKPAVECSARFAPGYRPENPEIQVDKIRRLFLDAWQGWTEGGSLAQAKIDDIDFGFTKLRLNSATWTGEDLTLGFSSPGIKVSNNSDVNLVYETKGPYTAWGGPYALAPGKSHEFPVAYPLTYRRKLDGHYSMFTLPAGSQLEFRRPAKGKEPSLFRTTAAVASPKPTAENPQPKP